MTDGSKPRSGADPATRAAKAFLGVASVAGTLGGWAMLASKEPSPARPEPVPQRSETPVKPAQNGATAVAEEPALARTTRVKRTRRVPITMTRSSR